MVIVNVKVKHWSWSFTNISYSNILLIKRTPKSNRYMTPQANNPSLFATANAKDEAL